MNVSAEGAGKFRRKGVESENEFQNMLGKY